MTTHIFPRDIEDEKSVFKTRHETSQELRMLSSVTINCQITKIVMISGSQLSVLLSVSQMSQVSGLSLLLLSIIVTIVVNVIIFIITHCELQGHLLSCSGQLKTQMRSNQLYFFFFPPSPAGKT